MPSSPILNLKQDFALESSHATVRSYGNSISLGSREIGHPAQSIPEAIAIRPAQNMIPTHHSVVPISVGHPEFLQNSKSHLHTKNTGGIFQNAAVSELKNGAMTDSATMSGNTMENISKCTDASLVRLPHDDKFLTAVSVDSHSIITPSLLTASNLQGWPSDKGLVYETSRKEKETNASNGYIDSSSSKSVSSGTVDTTQSKVSIYDGVHSNIPLVIDVEEDFDDCVLLHIDLSKQRLHFGKNIHNTTIVIDDSEEEEAEAQEKCNDKANALNVLKGGDTNVRNVSNNVCMDTTDSEIPSNTKNRTFQ